MTTGTPTQAEIDAIVQRAATQLAEQSLRVDWIPLPASAEQLEPPDPDGFVFVGWLVASGEPERQEGRLRRGPSQGKRDAS
jgi:hypothetical protein